jgi:CheY-like chemotaxis protein
VRSAGTILVVDDNLDTNEALARLLATRGYRVVPAYDGRQALDYLRSGGKPSLIVLDIRMPGMDGPGFRAEQLADPALARIPVIVYSVDREAKLPGAIAQVDKGVDVDVLLDLIPAVCA